MNKDKIIITWKFDKKENFGFLIPDDKNTYKKDFFVALRNSNKAENWDIVEAIELKKRQWKSSEVRILKIVSKNSNPSLNSLLWKRKENIEEEWENIIEWIYSQWRGDFWFVDVEGIEKWFFVFAQNKKWALDGDKVKAVTKVFNWKEEATVIKVTERKLDLIVWEYKPGKDNRFWFVIPNNPSVKVDIFVPGKRSMEAQAGDIVWVHVIDWTGKNPEWTIKEIIWKKGDNKIDVLSLIIEWWARLNFSEEVINYAKSFKTEIKEKESEKREDLTWLFTFTIDWEDAKDLDDAISIKKLETGWFKLFVHIADVSHYVREWNPLDKEAYKRATSTYLTDRVIPMLPEALSNDLCSLNPNTKKLTLTCEMIIWNNWKIKSQKVYESIISSDFRLTYKEVDEIIEWKINENDELMFGWIVSKEIVTKLKLSNLLKDKITKYRNLIGVLNFEFPETKILLDDDWKPVEIKEYPRHNSNKLIEEFMISANEAVSREFSDLPFLYRIHEEPKEDSIAKLQETLNLFWINFQLKNGDTKEFSELIDSLENEKESKKMFLEKAILRTLSKAVYSKENFWHFGLGLSFYSHFTSPIRRYPDLQIHRIIKEKIHWKLNKSRKLYYDTILEKVSKHTSDKERKAEKLEYKVRDYFTVQFYKDKVWEEFDANINWVISKWFFVTLKDTSEWFVEMNNSEFRDELQEHKDLSSWKVYKLWDSLNVRLIEADESLLRLNFEIV